MSKPRRIWPLLTAVLIGLPVLYVLSCGPVYWLQWNTEIPDWLEPSVSFYLRPLVWMHADGPNWLHNLLEAYLVVWGHNPDVRY